MLRKINEDKKIEIMFELYRDNPRKLDVKISSFLGYEVLVNQ